MEIKFDPTVLEERIAVTDIIDLFAGYEKSVRVAVADHVHTRWPEPAAIAPNDNPAIGQEVLTPLESPAPMHAPPGMFGQSVPDTAAAGQPPIAQVMQYLTVPVSLPSALPPSLPAAAPAATLPLAAMPSAPAQIGTLIERDSRGLPWDARIHSAEKSKNKDLTWRNKRGVDKNVIQTVEAQLYAMAATPGASVPPPVPAPAPVPIPAGPGAAPALSFASLAATVAQYQQAGKITFDEATNIAVQCGLQSFDQLAHADEPTLQNAFAWVNHYVAAR